MRILLSGPCGVGKSAVAGLLVAAHPDTAHLDLDCLRSASDGISIRPGCGVRYLNLEDCAGDRVRESGRSVVLDIGGDTLFRDVPVDNSERLAQLLDFKRRHEMLVVVLDGDRGVVRDRFLGCKSRQPAEFEESWASWTAIARPCWLEAADRVVDTSNLQIGVARDEKTLLERVLGESSQA